MSKKIAYVGEFVFPYGAATTKRALGLARLFSACGYEVSFYGLITEAESKNLASGKFENFSFSNQILKDTERNILLKLFNWLVSGYRMVRLFAPTKPDYIILTEGYSRYLLPLLFYSKKHKTKIIVDIEDWHEYQHLPFGRFGPFALDCHLAITKLIKKCDGVIAISSFFENYYRRSDVKVIRIPVLIDKEKHHANSEKIDCFDKDHLHLIYIGNHNNRDILDTAIIGIHALVMDGVKVKLHLVGPSKQSIEELLGNKSYLLEELPESIVFHGWVDSERVSLLLANADFSFFIRPDKRYANACFPTKFVESMSAGLPIICNLTSDLGMHVKDGENGFIMKDESVQSFKECVKKASQISEEKKKQMKLAAKAEAHKSFDYRDFMAPVKEFFREIDSQP